MKKTLQHEPGITGDCKLFKAKLQAPTINKNAISREKLLAKLYLAQENKLTLVTAPAGFGKTTAVLDWLDQCTLPSAWISLDSQDNDPVTFWQYVYAALEKIVCGIGTDAEYVFSSQELMKAGVHINILIDRLSEAQRDFLLVLDDLHLINDPSILKNLSFLIDYLPAKMHLIFIGRMEPEFDSARHRIKWQAQRLEENDLRFDKEDIVHFFQARGYALDDGNIEKIEKYTEGWAAALVAVAMSMEKDDGNGSAIAGLARSSRDIEQYLKDEVIGAWSQERRIFAMKTSVLDTLSEALCNAVTGDGNGGKMLMEISEGSGFLTPLDEQMHNYRYHHLFKSFFQKLLSETAPEEIFTLHTKAGKWYLQQGQLPEAIDHFLNGKAYEQAFDLIEHQIDDMLRRFEFGRLLPWVKRLPDKYRDGSFKIAAIYALYYASADEYALSRQWIARMKELKEGYPHAPNPKWNRYSERVCMMAEAYLLVREGNNEFVRLIFSAAEMNSGGAYRITEYYDLNAADAYFYRCPVGKVTGLFRQAPELYDKMAESYRGIISKNPGYSPLAVGEYLYEINRAEESIPQLLKALEEAREARCPGALVPAMVNIARIKRADGDISGAFSVLNECEKQLNSMGKAHWLYLLDAFRCRLNLDIGNMDQVREWLAKEKLNIFSEISRIREFELIVFSRALISLKRTQDAQLLLQRLLAFSEETKRLHSRVEVLNILALLTFRENRIRLALKYIDESLGIGLSEGYIRSYLDELAPMAQLLRAYIKSRGKQSEDDLLKKRKAFAAELLAQIRHNLLQTAQAHDEVSPGAAGEIMDQFTAQEKRVLELIMNADTNEKICEKLGISLRTVKTHTGNIYAKLGVKNRVQCIKLVRELSLL